MNIKKSKFIFIIFFSVLVNAQELPQVIPPSPETQQFNKYVNFDVSLYNGLTEVKVPLYEISLKGVTIPIYLSYHGSGIQAGQFPGEAGIGWTFNPGYRISRTIYGQPDELADMPSNIQQTLLTYPDVGLDRDEYLSRYLISTNGFSQPTSTEGKLDGEFDQFNISLPNSGDGFIITDRSGDGEFATVNGTNIKLKYTKNGNDIEGFKAIDADGINYYFGHEYSSLDPDVYEASTIGPYHTAWALTNLITPGGENIEFKYQSGSAGGWNSYARSFTFYEAHPTTGASSHYNWTDGTDNSYTSFYLNEIIIPNGKIQLTRNGGNRITQLKVIDDNNEVLRNVKFYYLNSNQIYLDRLEFLDKNDLVIQNYSFDYYNKNDDLYQFSHDQWGYFMETGFSGPGSTHLFHEEFFDDNIKTSGSPYAGQPLTSIFDEAAPRTSITIAPSYCSLKSITYPTGGRTEYIYENNQYLNSQGYITNGGGIRIGEIKKYDNNNELVLKRRYTYGTNEDGVGVLVSGINFRWFTNEYPSFFYNNPYLYSQRVINYSTSMMGDSDKGGFLGSNIIYPKVNEYYISSKNASKNSGRIENIYDLNYTYTANSFVPPVNFNGNENWWSYQYYSSSPVFVRNYNLWNKPIIREQNIFSSLGDSSYEIKKTIKYTYSSSFDTYYGLKVRPFAYADYTPVEEDYYLHIPSFFHYGEYTISCGLNKLTKKEEFNYSNNGTLTQTILFDYNTSNQIISETTITSSGDNRSMEYSYPIEMVENFQDPTGIYQTMLDKNLLNPIIKNEKFEGGYLINSTLTDYSDFSGQPLPNSITAIKGSESFLNGQSVAFHSYNSTGKPLEISREDGPHIFYLWGYNDQYPIAKIENSSFTEITTALSQELGVTVSDLKTINETHLGAISAIRESLPNAMVTTYEYEPLFGITKITDPKGLEITYEYDEFGRLEFVKDDQDNLLNEYKYHYQQ